MFSWSVVYNQVVNTHWGNYNGNSTSYIYQVFKGNDYSTEANKLFGVYQYIRKSDEEYLMYLTEESSKILP